MYTFIQLENGIKIGLFKMEGVKSVALKAMLAAGPVIESEENNGASHFIEHIVLDGTKSYPTKLDFANTLEELGVSYGGYTSTQEMGFEFDVPYTNIKQTLAILREILFEPLFTDDVIEKERKVILEEMIDRNNSPEFQFYCKMMQQRFNQHNHPLTRKVIGTKEIIETIPKKDLLALYHQIFVPSNIYMCLVGNMDTDDLIAYIKDIFGSYAHAHNVERPVFSNSEESSYLVSALEDEKLSNVYSAITFPSYSREVSTKTELSMRIFKTMFAGLRTSRLFQDVREKEGLVYNIASDWDPSWGSGIFSISFESDYPNIDRIMEIVFRDIRQIQDEGFRDEELHHMKNYLNNRTLLSFSSPWNINAWILDYLFDGEEILFPENLIEIGNQIGHEDINRVIQDTFDFKAMNVFMMGKLGDYDIQKTMKKLGFEKIKTQKLIAKNPSITK